MHSRNFLARTTILLTALLTLTVAIGTLPARAATRTVDVAGAMADNTGTAQVTGYVVGQPTGSDTITRTAGDNYSLALADSATETNPSKMLFVQVTAAYRAQWGLKSNPELLGTRIRVTGTLQAYFSHPGLKSPTAFATGSGTPTPTGSPTATPTSSPTPKPTPTSTATPGPDPTGYYAGTAGLTGEPLKQKLNQIISRQTVLSYDQVWDGIADTDEDPANPNNVILLYTGRSQAKSERGGDVDDWNREHVWAKSHGDFGTANGPGTDLHHLRATDVTVNSTRSNKDFDLGGDPLTEAPANRTDADSFEPRDEVKGDVARMILYMDVRYEGGDGRPDLEAVDRVGTGTAPEMGKLSVLLQWNDQDPVSETERRRNEVIFTKWQGNRNPFIDNPQFARAIWG
ncbi:endonuclease [Enemella evansiae]|uniref:endonuclease n=1 Tax=Enemella evansiae TaxID=2016499 RepID=UPI001061BB9C|nr:endonuclease [Enemella evansiae]TDO92951.1 endonuclease I [Enemella evansiae]